MRTILSLCDYSGAWSSPYEKAGYHVLMIDLQRGQDVRLMRRLDERVHGILAAPPCDHFSKAGAWTWQTKGDGALLDGLSIVDACLRAVILYRPSFWCLENPSGRLGDFLGPPAFRFDPCDFGDPWTKRTCLWGHFTPPMPLFCPSAIAVAPTLGDITTRKSGKDKNGRSATPTGFAQAFYEANQ